MKKATRMWISLLLIGFIGQVAWVIENMYFNVFVYNTLTTDINVIAAMVSLSAITATVTTLLMGNLSDAVGKRKPFISFGYLIWGFTVIAFSFLNLNNVGKLLPGANADAAAGSIAVFLDCVMTFFGSTGNDAAFNAWVTDNVEKKDRTKVEGVLATLPLLSMLLVFGLLDGFTQKGQWSTFFLIIGILTSLGGLVSFVTLPKEKTVKKETTDLFYGFKKDVILKHKKLYWAFLMLLVFSISTQVFMPYLIIYIQTYLGITNYAPILGIVLLGASIFSVWIGNTAGKVGEDLFFTPSVILLCVGLLFMFLVRKPVGVIIAGLIMMGGNLVVTSLVNSTIRTETPKEKAGNFQGIRMIFGVMLPMIIGPYIGSFVIHNSAATYIDMGQVKNVPTPWIFLAAAVIAALTILPYNAYNREKAKDAKVHVDLLTPYGEKLDKNHVLKEYPRPQMQRESYLNLNGEWNYAIRKEGEALGNYDGKILVPFSPETLLSGVNRQVTPEDVLYYQKTFTLPKDFNEGLVWLHFGAVDQIAEVTLNGTLLGSHTGGYLPFSFEISPYLKEENVLEVKVKDYSDTSYYSIGKQSSHRGGIWYTPQSGIWQTVWLESTPEKHIDSLRLTPFFDEGKIRIEVKGNEESYRYEIFAKGKKIAETEGSKTVEMEVNELHPWTPEDPFLYDLTVSGEKDTVTSYFGMRKFSIEKDAKGLPRLCLNNQPYFHKGVLDQGYYSDGLYTAASDHALIDDIQLVKDMGFNMIRKHIKIEPLRWYYHCDKMGILVWQDMVNGGTSYDFGVIGALPFIGITLKDNDYKKFARESEQGRQMYYDELKATVELLYNTVSLALWVPFNEGWGQFDAVKAYKMLKEMDPTRSVDHASGWHDQGVGDLNSRHIYFAKIKFKQDTRVSALTEYGGYSRIEAGHVYNSTGYGYALYEEEEDLTEAFEKLHTEQILPLVEKGLSATVYTQLSDVEDEVNGLVTFDRKKVKYPKEQIRDLMDQIHL